MHSWGYLSVALSHKNTHVSLVQTIIYFMYVSYTSANLVSFIYKKDLGGGQVN